MYDIRLNHVNNDGRTAFPPPEYLTVSCLASIYMIHWLHDTLVAKIYWY